MKLAPKKEINAVKKSRLVKNQETLQNKKDMRKKPIKSPYPTLKKQIQKKQTGGVFADFESVGNTEQPTFNPYNFYASRTVATEPPLPVTKVEPIAEEVPEVRELSVPVNIPIAETKHNISSSQADFERYYDEVEQVMPEAKDLRPLLTKLAQRESGFNSYVQNKQGAPAYGYFQFMDFNIPDGDIEGFRNDPKRQIMEAVKLANKQYNQLSKQDLELANSKGLTKNALIAGTWLGGAGGVKKVLHGKGNPTDKHWSKSGKVGSTVNDYMQQFNFKEGGKIDKENLKSAGLSTAVGLLLGTSAGIATKLALDATRKPAIEQQVVEIKESRFPKYDFNKMAEEYKERKIHPELMEHVQNYLQDKDITDQQYHTFLTTIINESGGNPYAKGGPSKGILQWKSDRYDFDSINKTDTIKELNKQLDHMLETAHILNDGKSWTSGGKGTGYRTSSNAYNIFNNPDSNLEDVLKSYTLGHIRPGGKHKSVKNRLNTLKEMSKYKKEN